MKNILYLANNYDFGLSNGASIVINEQIKVLSKIHNVYFINFITDTTLNSQNNQLNIKYFEEIVIKNIFGLFDYPKVLKSIPEEIDYVVATSAFQDIYIESFKKAKFIYLVNNSEYQQQKHALLNIDNKEERICKQSYINLFLTEKDYLYFKSINLVRKNDLVIPPFIDNQNIQSIQRIANQALITTNLDTDYNKLSLKWFLEEVYPLLNNDIKLVITGKGNWHNIIPHYKNIEFKGYIERQELIELYNESSLYINPTKYGSGIQVKLLEALSYNMNAVSTDYSNTFPHIINASDNPQKLAKLINDQINTTSYNFNIAQYNKVNIKKFAELFK
jgi:hypothetical protein